MTEENDSKYGKGFTMRMIVLVGLLALVAGGLYYDRVILPAKAKNTINEAYKLMVAPDEDGHGITKDQVQKTIGFAPDSETIVEDIYEVERYSFKRALPFMEGDFLNVIYENGALVNILQNKEYSAESVKDNMGFKSAADDSYTGNEVELGGVPRSSMPGAEEEDSDEEDSDDDATDEDATDEDATDEDATDEDATDEEDSDDDATDDDATDEDATGEDATGEEDSDEDDSDEDDSDEEDGDK